MAMEQKPEDNRDPNRPSEFELIERVRGALGSQGDLEVGPGDDAAVVDLSGPVVVSVDSMVEGVHFPADWPDPEDLACRALAGALSDLAAMAADPRTTLIAIGLPAGRTIGFEEGLADAMVAAARRFGVSLAGGDIVRSPNLFISVTVIGALPEGRSPITRSGARPGDLVAVTGRLGGSAAGLELATGSELPVLEPEMRDALMARYLRPVPLNSLGSALGAIGPTAMVDVSDGLVADLGHLAEASGVAIDLDADAVPAEQGVDVVARATGREALDLVLGGGEDYELAMTLDREDLPAIEQIAGSRETQLTVIGEVGEGSGVRVTASGRPIEPPSGFEHSF